jgi:hypothetical protein
MRDNRELATGLAIVFADVPQPRLASIAEQLGSRQRRRMPPAADILAALGGAAQ